MPCTYRTYQLVNSLRDSHIKFQPYWFTALCLNSFESCRSSDFQKMDEREFRVFIKHYFMKSYRPGKVCLNV